MEKYENVCKKLNSTRAKYERKRLNLKNRTFTSLKTSNIPFSPNIPHYAMWHKPPQSYIAMLAEPALP